jgi:hypothetical protein
MSMGIAAAGGSGGHGAVSGASSYATPTAKMSNLYSQIDTSGSGSVNKAQFDQAFATKNPPGVFKAAGADAVFSQLDTKGTGNVSQSDFVSGMTSLMRSLRGAEPTPTTATTATSQAASPADTLAASLQSFNQLGGSPSSTNGLGTVVDLLA